MINTLSSFKIFQIAFKFNEGKEKNKCEKNFFISHGGSQESEADLKA